jgi:hypothetical protein
MHYNTCITITDNEKRGRKRGLPMTEEPEKPINLLWAIDEIPIALQRLRKRIRRMAEHDIKPRHPPRKP